MECDLHYLQYGAESFLRTWPVLSCEEIPRILCNSKVHYCIHPSLFWARSIQSMPPLPTSWKSILIFILLSTLGSTKWSLSLRCSHQNPIYTFCLPHTCYMPSPSNSSRFDHLNNTAFGVHVNKLLILFSPLPSYLAPLRPKYSNVTFITFRNSVRAAKQGVSIFHRQSKNYSANSVQVISCCGNHTKHKRILWAEQRCFRNETWRYRRYSQGFTGHSLHGRLKDAERSRHANLILALHTVILV